MTFFSSTNESVKDVMGYQPDRRIVEFTIAEKKGEIAEEDIVAWLNEIWRVMPVEHPRQQAIKDELLEASSKLNDLNMGDVAYELFKDNNAYAIANNHNRINLFKFKMAVKELGGVPFIRIRDWCVDNLIFTKDKGGKLYLSKRGLKHFLDNHREASGIGESTVESELDELLKVEG